MQIAKCNCPFEICTLQFAIPCFVFCFSVFSVTLWLVCRTDSPGEKIVRVYKQGRFGSDESAARDARDHLAINHLDGTFENAAHDAFLSPDFAGSELTVGEETGELGAGA